MSKYQQLFQTGNETYVHDKSCSLNGSVLPLLSVLGSPKCPDAQTYSQKKRSLSEPGMKVDSASVERVALCSERNRNRALYRTIEDKVQCIDCVDEILHNLIITPQM